MKPSRDAAHFQRLYAATDDPWNFEASAYEQAKYRHSLAVLGQRHFAAGLEAGCSIGVLTRMLSERCGTLVGIDLVEAPLRLARQRCPGVRFARMQVPEQWPAESFDLIVLSELLYFLNRTDIIRCAARVAASLRPGGLALLVNWLHQTDDPVTGDEAAELFIASSREALAVLRQERTDDYRLDLLTTSA